MLNKQEIANLALGRIGVSAIISDLDNDNSNQAKVIRRHFKMSLETLLASHEWGFATQYQALPLISANPIPGFIFCYALPGDCLNPRILAPEGRFPLVKQYEAEKEKWREIYNGSGGRKIYSNVMNAHLEYTVNLPLEISFPTHFGRALGAQLAMDIAAQLVTNNFPKIEDALMKKAQNEISKGISTDIGMQPQLEDSPSPFITARLV